MIRPRRRSLWRAAWLLALTAVSARGEVASLGARVRDSVRELHELEDLYRRGDEPRERAALVGLMSARAAWLEQVGGLREARAGQLLALARWEALGRSCPPYYAFGAEANGEPVAELVVRRARPGELPLALQPFEPQLLYVLLRNVSPRAQETGEGPVAEFRRGGLMAKSVPAVKEGALPGPLRPLAELFAWPERLQPGQEVQALAFFPPADGTLSALTVSLREAGREGGSPRTLRCSLEAGEDAAGMVQARRDAARIEQEIKAEREKRRPPPETVASRPDKPEPPLLPPVRHDVPAPNEPRALGRVEPTSGEGLVMVRLDTGVSFDWGVVFRVRKNGVWTGRLRIERGPTDPAHPDARPVYFARILEGTGDTLARGTLHKDE